MANMETHASWDDQFNDRRRLKPGGVGPGAGLDLRFGVAQFDTYDPLTDLDKLENWGFDYCEPQVVKIMDLIDSEFQAIVKKTRTSRIHVEVMNGFLPGDLKVVGSRVDRVRLTDYVQGALARAESLGTKVIVFGSGEARKVPEGFSKARAWIQLQKFLQMAGDEIMRNRYGMVIGIEALQKAECNLVNTSAEAYKLAVQTHHPKIRIMVDFFHLNREGEDPAIMRQLKGHLVHLHFADPFRGRTFPLIASGQSAYRAFFSNLAEIGYRGRLSLEAFTSNFDSDAPAGLAAVQKIYSEFCAG